MKTGTKFLTKRRGPTTNRYEKNKDAHVQIIKMKSDRKSPKMKPNIKCSKLKTDTKSPKLKADVKNPKLKHDIKSPKVKPDGKSRKMTTNIKSSKTVTRSSTSELSVAIGETSADQNVEQNIARKRRSSIHSACVMCCQLEPNSKGDCKERLARSNGGISLFSLRKRRRSTSVDAMVGRKGGDQNQKAETVEANDSGCSLPVLRLTQVEGRAQSDSPGKMTLDKIARSHRWQPYVRIQRMDITTCTTTNWKTLNCSKVEDCDVQSLTAKSCAVSSELLACESVPAGISASLQTDVDEPAQELSEAAVAKPDEDEPSECLESEARESTKVEVGKSSQVFSQISNDEADTCLEDKTAKSPVNEAGRSSIDAFDNHSECKITKSAVDETDKSSKGETENEAGLSSIDTSAHHPECRITESAVDETDKFPKDDTENGMLKSSDGKGFKSSEEVIGKPSDDMDDHLSVGSAVSLAEGETATTSKDKAESETLKSSENEGLEEGETATTSSDKTESVASEALKSSEDESLAEGEAVTTSKDKTESETLKSSENEGLAEGETATTSNGKTESEMLKSYEDDGFKSSEDDSFKSSEEEIKLPETDVVASSDVKDTEIPQDRELDSTQTANVDAGKSSESDDVDMVSINNSNEIVGAIPEPSSVSKTSPDKCENVSEVDNVDVSMQELVIETSNTSQKISDYLKSNSVPKKSAIDIIKFAEHVGLLPKEVETELLQSLGRLLKSKTNDSECFEFKTFRTFLDSRVERGESAEQMYTCVTQIVRCMSGVDSRVLQNISTDFALKCDHVMNFLHQINDNVINSIYAKSYLYLIEFILQTCGRLTASKRRYVDNFKILLNQFCDRKDTPSVVLCNNFITRHPSILDRVNEHLSMQCNDYYFILNYLNTYLCLECLKPTWAFREATLTEYKNSVIIGGCQVMLVISGSLWCVIVWRKEAMRLLHHYVNMFRHRNSKVQNLKENLFLNFHTKQPLSSDLNIANWISNVGQVENDKEQFMKYFNLHMNRLSKHVQTNPLRGFSIVPTSTCSTQTELEPACSSEADSLQPLTLDHLKQCVSSALTHKPTPPLVRVEPKQRTVGIQCSFKILMKTNNNLNKDFYNFTPVDNQIMLVPATHVETSERGTDPIVIQKRHVKAQTRSIVISQRENVTKCTQTESAENSSYLLLVPSNSDCPMAVNSTYGALVMAQPTDDLDDVIERCYPTKTFGPVRIPLSADDVQSDSSTSDNPVFTVSEAEAIEDDDEITICAGNEDDAGEEAIEASTSVTAGDGDYQANVTDDGDEDDEPIIVEEIVSPSVAASPMVNNRRINTVEAALKHWPPTVDGNPLTFQQTGLTRENYLRYHKTFSLHQTNLRAKVIISNLRLKYRKITDKRVEKEARIHNWMVDKTLLARCYSNFMYKSV